MRLKHLFTLLIILFQTLATADEIVLSSIVENEFYEQNPALFKQLEEVWTSYQQPQKAGDKERALASLRNIVRTYPDFLIAKRLLGSHYYRTNNYTQAEILYLEILSARPNYYLVQHDLAVLQFAMKRRMDAVRALERILNKPDISLQLQYAIHETLIYANELVRAAQILENLLIKLPHDETYADTRLGFMSKLTDVYERLNEYERAEQHYKQLIKLKPGEAFYWGNYASFVMRKYGDADFTIELGEMALSLKNYLMVKYYMAFAYYSKWIHAVENNSRNAEIYLRKAYELVKPSYDMINRANQHKGTSEAARAMVKIYNDQFKGDLAKENYSAEVLIDYAYFKLFYENNRDSAYRYAQMAYKKSQSDRTAFVYACVLYEMWNHAKSTGDHGKAEKFRNNAENIYRNTQKVVDELVKFTFTHPAGNALVVSHSDYTAENRKPENQKKFFERHLQSFTGTYESELFDRIEFIVEGTNMSIKVPDGQVLPLTHDGNIYHPKTTLNGKPLELSITRGPTTEFNFILYKYQGVTTTFAKVAGFTPSFFRRLSGTYSLNMNPYLKVFAKGDQLYLEKDNKVEALYLVDLRITMFRTNSISDKKEIQFIRSSNGVMAEVYYFENGQKIHLIDNVKIRY